jgi:hypothetical protein
MFGGRGGRGCGRKYELFYFKVENNFSSCLYPKEICKPKQCYGFYYTNCVLSLRIFRRIMSWFLLVFLLVKVGKNCTAV